MWKTAPLSQNPNSSLRLPAQKRIELLTSQRLTAITEDPGTPPPIPRRSSRRGNSPSNSFFSSQRLSRRWSESNASQNTGKTPPPPYDWVPGRIDGLGSNTSEEGDARLEKLRRGEGEHHTKRRGGRVRLALIVGLVLLVIIALGVGLGVGLTRKKSKESNNDDDQSSEPSSDDAPPQKFPLGQYSLVTALKGVETSCTSNPATWRCYPYVLYSSDGSTNDTSLASFNWIISNTSASYATSAISSTPDAGIPANLTVKTNNDPFSITFTDKALTYIASPTNSSAARYTFSFTMQRLVVPSPPLSTKATECFFNQTVFTGSMYLSTPHSFPSGGDATSLSLGGYEQWPHAVEITQSATGGSNVPNCYETADGKLGDRITSGLTAQPESAECLCDYRNY